MKTYKVTLKAGKVVGRVNNQQVDFSGLRLYATVTGHDLEHYSVFEAVAINLDIDETYILKIERVS